MSDLLDPIPTREKVLVVGAGPAGLAAAAALQAVGLPFDLIDSGHDVGGIWDAGSPTPVWDAMRPISSKEMTQFEDLLMPVSFPEFPSPEDLSNYLRAYAARHRLTDHFRPGVTLRRAAPFEQGQWQYELSSGEVGVYRALILATGTSSRPHLPAWARPDALGDGAPEGVRMFPARDWTGPEGLEGRRVLVVGSGQSAADIAVDASSRALEVRWSVRTGHWVVPRTVAGMPGDVAAAREPALLGGLNEKIAEAVISRTIGTPQSVGLPAPQVPLLDDRVIVSDDVLARIREGRITPVQDVTALAADGTVSLAGGTTWRPDVIVLATGYEHALNVLAPDTLPTTPTGAPDLFLGAFPRGRDDLVVLGQMRTSGGIWPLLAQQADVAAYFLRAVAENRPEAEEFRRVRRGGDASVATRAPADGLRGRLAGALEHLQDAARRPAGVRTVRESGQLPFVDREDLSSRLVAVREIFEPTDPRA